MTTIILHLCGLLGDPRDELDGRTVLEVADPPALRRLSIEGSLGTVSLVPQGMFREAGVEALALLGYEPPRETGLGALEALGIGVSLGSREVGFRVNLVATDGERLLDARAGRITHGEACRLMEEVDRRLSTRSLSFYPGQDHAHVMVWTEGPLFAVCTPALEAEGRSLEEVLPVGDGEAALRRLVWDSYEILDSRPYNVRRRGEGLLPANMIWPWAPSRAPALRPLALRASLRAQVWTSRLAVMGAARALEVPFSLVPPTLQGTAPDVVARLSELDLAYLQADVAPLVREEGDPEEWVAAVRRLSAELVEPLCAHVAAGAARTRLLVVATRAEGRPETPPDAVWAAFPPLRGRAADAGEFTERAARELGASVDEGWRLLEVVSRG